MTATYYHVSTNPLPPGTTLRTPAEWSGREALKVAIAALDSGDSQLAAFLLADWRVALSANGRMELEIYAREAIFESVRAAEFSDCPARADACFLWEEIDAAHWFVTTVSKSGTIYECTVQGDAGRGRLDVLQWDGIALDPTRPLEPQFAVAREAARRYYGQEPSDNPRWEILVCGDASARVERSVA